MLKQQNRILFSNFSISSVESFTGGLFSSKMIENAGSSKWFKGSFVLYQNEAKEEFGIKTNNGVINKETALAMTKLGREKFKSDFCVSFTGNAGPDVLDGKSVGLIYIGINEDIFEFLLSGERNEIRNKAVEIALELLISKKIIKDSK